MRWVVSGLFVVAALLLIAASILMNWTFWTGQGADAQSSRALGVVSIGVDIFKATLPLIIAWAWRERLRLGVVIGIVDLPRISGEPFALAGWRPGGRSRTSPG